MANENTASNENNSSEKQVKKRPRIQPIDELRGLAIFCMVFFHAFYTIGYFFNYEWGITLVNFFMPAEPFFAGLFILLSGIVSNMSHSNLERGVKLMLISLGVTLVTYLVLGYENIISFGVLHMLACCMLLYGLSNKYLKLIPSWIGILFNVIMFWFTYLTTHHQMGFPPFFTFSLPDNWYDTKFLFMFGFPHDDFVSSDYFPLLPWLFLFFAGTYIGRICVKKKFPNSTLKKRIPFFGFLGRHSLIIYLAHQPIIFALCYTYNFIAGLFHH